MSLGTRLDQILLLASAVWSKTPTKVLIYLDLGTASYVANHKEEFLNNLIETLLYDPATHHEPTEVSPESPLGFIAEPLPYNLRREDFEYIDAERIREGSWKASTRLLIFPGGGDLGYCEKLNGEGNKHIRSFVEDYGGKYLGFCAGAYYASGECKFDMFNFKENPIVGKRELAFFPGIAEGPYLGNYSPVGEKTSIAAGVSVKRGVFPELDAECERAESITNGSKDMNHGGFLASRRNNLHVYYNGGPLFVDAKNYAGKGVTVLAEYYDTAAAIIEVEQSSGGKVLLSAVHPEITTTYLRSIIRTLRDADRQHLEEDVLPFLKDERYRPLLKGMIGRLIGEAQRDQNPRSDELLWISML